LPRWYSITPSGKGKFFTPLGCHGFETHKTQRLCSRIAATALLFSASKKGVVEMPMVALCKIFEIRRGDCSPNNFTSKPADLHTSVHLLSSLPQRPTIINNIFTKFSLEYKAASLASASTGAS